MHKNTFILYIILILITMFVAAEVGAYNVNKSDKSHVRKQIQYELFIVEFILFVILLSVVDLFINKK